MPRMRRGLRALAAGGLGLAVSLVAACGSNSGLLSSSDASTLQNLIQQVSADVNSGNCAAVPGDLASLTRALDNLPSSVSSKLRASLNEGVGKVTALAQRNCPATATATTTTSTTTTTHTTTSPTTTTSTTPTHTATAPPTTPATTPANPGTTTTGPGSGGTGLGNAGGNGGGGGNGNGNGNGH
jgi:hypothetical protein